MEDQRERASYIIAVTGGRDYTNEKIIAWALHREFKYATEDLGRHPVLLTGGCPTGLDELARQLWHRWQRPYVVDPAAFRERGPAAGPQRNGRMAIGSTFAMDPPFHPDVLLRFPGGRGTADCEERMRAMGVPVVPVAALSVTEKEGTADICAIHLSPRAVEEDPRVCWEYDGTTDCRFTSRHEVRT